MTADKYLNICLAVVALSAATLTGVVVARLANRRDDPNGRTFAVVPDWRQYTTGGHRLGPAAARAVVTEFADFQCPYCARTARELDSLRAHYPTALAVVYHNYPLEEIHPSALGAAIAAECAGHEAAFASFHDELFKDQTWLGVKSWTWFARRARLVDIAAFDACTRSKQSAAAVERDIDLGNRLGVTATPTLLVNEYRILVPASPGLIDSLVRVVLAE